MLPPVQDHAVHGVAEQGYLSASLLVRVCQSWPVLARLAGWPGPTTGKGMGDGWNGVEWNGLAVPSTTCSSADYGIGTSLETVPHV